MLNKLGNAMTEAAQQAAAEFEEKGKLLQTLFEQHVEGYSAFTKGVVQTEKDVNSIGGLASKALLNTAVVEYTDYLAAANTSDGTLLLLEIQNGEVANKHEFKKGQYKIKKESKLLDEIIGSIFPRRRDRYNRERFVVSGEGKKYRLLVGPYVTEGTDYPYDNKALLQELKKLTKQ